MAVDNLIGNNFFPRACSPESRSPSLCTWGARVRLGTSRTSFRWTRGWVSFYLLFRRKQKIWLFQRGCSLFIQSMLHLTLVLDGGPHFETATKFTLEIAAWLKSINKLTQLWPRWQPHQNHLSRVHKLRSSKKVNFWFTLTLIDNLLAVVRRNNLSWENFWCCDGLNLVHCPLHSSIPNWNWREKYTNKTQTLGTYSCLPRCNVLVRQVDACLSNLEINDRVYVLRPTWQGGDLLGGLDIGEYLITDHYDHKTHTMGYQTHAMGCHAIPIVQFFWTLFDTKRLLKGTSR